MTKKDIYVKVESFTEFCRNQEKLIEILNHRMTNLEGDTKKIGNTLGMVRTDVSWLKKSLWVIIGLLTTLTGVTLVKSLIGG